MADVRVRDPQVAAQLFQPLQLTRAREIAGLTKAAIAERVGKTASAIGQFEAGKTRPDSSTLAAISLTLGFPVSFFARRHSTVDLNLEQCHFRSLRSVSQIQRRQAVRQGELLRDLIAELEHEGIDFPSDALTPIRVSPLPTSEIEEYASSVRKHWNLGLGPIPALLPLLEARGVRILPLERETERVDAFSFWFDGHPYMMLDLSKQPSRIHFDAAHELGHLLIHEDVAPGDPRAESAADAFASAFLLPKASFPDEAPNHWNYEKFIALKRRWHVSIAALVMRSRRVGRLSDASLRRAFQFLNAHGVRRSEPAEWELAGAVALVDALNLVAEDVSISVLAGRLDVHEALLWRYLRSVSSRFHAGATT